MDLMIVSGIDPSNIKPGGTRTYVLDLIQFLLDHQINVTLVGVSYSNKVSEQYPFNFIAATKKPGISSFWYLLGLFIKALFLHIPESCIIHAQRTDILFPFVLFHRKNRTVCTIHGYDSRAIFSKKGYLIGKIFNLLEKYSLKRVDIVVMADDSTRKLYVDRYKWLKEKSTVIPVGVNTVLFKPMNKQDMRKKHGFDEIDRIIIYVGRLEKDKRLDMLIESFGEVEEQISYCKLVLVGDGRERTKLEILAQSLGLDDNILFLGNIEHDILPEVICCGDLFAMCSAYESGPLVIQEALACGVPVVTTKVGRVKEFITNDDVGRIVENDEEYAEVLCGMLLQNLENEEETKQICRKAALGFSFEIIDRKIVEVYKNLEQNPR